MDGSEKWMSGPYGDQRVNIEKRVKVKTISPTAKTDWSDSSNRNSIDNDSNTAAVDRVDSR